MKTMINSIGRMIDQKTGRFVKITKQHEASVDIKKVQKMVDERNAYQLRRFSYSLTNSPKTTQRAASLRESLEKNYHLYGALRHAKVGSEESIFVPLRDLVTNPKKSDVDKGRARLYFALVQLSKSQTYGMFNMKFSISKTKEQGIVGFRIWRRK